jgi:hypothetical protein
VLRFDSAASYFAIDRGIDWVGVRIRVATIRERLMPRCNRRIVFAKQREHKPTPPADEPPIWRRCLLCLFLASFRHDFRDGRQQQECLDYFVVFGQQHMDHLVTEMITHYHEERPHQARENEPLILASAKPPNRNRKKEQELLPDGITASQLECRERLGGVLKHYFRPAA